MSSFFSPGGFEFPLPINEGAEILETQVDFQLPFEIEYLIHDAGNSKAVMRIS
jgi:hypothetical protein